MESILKYQQDCFERYNKTVGFKPSYTYIDGNPIRPIVPVETAINGLMIVGAYPSARFESRMGRLLPVADNLAPFYPELYFDGVRVRKQESAHGLMEYILRSLNCKREKCWITDLVKVFLFKREHIENYKRLGFRPEFNATREKYAEYAKRSIGFLFEEIQIAKPKLIITLGEEVARVLTKDNLGKVDELLNGKPYRLLFSNKNYFIAHVAHPDACRRFSKWRDRTLRQMKLLSKFC